MVQNVIWKTCLDDKGRLYFYTKDGRSEWDLPEVPSMFNNSPEKNRKIAEIVRN